MSFSSDIAKFRRKAMENVNGVKRLASLRLASAVILSTPVKKGVLRNNWFVGIGSPSEEVNLNVPDTPVQAGVIIERAKSRIESTDIGDEINLTNNLPYAPRIEFDGYSALAPDGMVRINTLNWDTIVKNAVRDIRLGVA